MKISKFYNETFDCTLELIMFSYEKKGFCKKVIKQLDKRGQDKSKITRAMESNKAFCSTMQGGNIITIVFDRTSFKDSTDKITTLQHECNHFREAVLEWMGEIIGRTDSEACLRISDWAFKKCMSTKFFKSLLK